MAQGAYSYLIQIATGFAASTVTFFTSNPLDFLIQISPSIPGRGYRSLQGIMDSPILFDPDGDLRLEVGAKINPEEQLECIVCSKTLSRATSVFKNMLYGPFRESRASSSAALSTQNWVVELPEDNPQAMKILLGSMHSQYEHVPTALSLTELYQVLLVCDKYDTIRMIRPWAQLWFLPHTPLAKSTGNEILMWIAWELGSENVFREVAARLCLECEVDPEGHLLDSQGNLLQMYECPWPSSILGRQIC